jgi:hypothetical protein
VSDACIELLLTRIRCPMRSDVSVLSVVVHDPENVFVPAPVVLLHARPVPSSCEESAELTRTIVLVESVRFDPSVEKLPDPANVPLHVAVFGSPEAEVHRCVYVFASAGQVAERVEDDGAVDCVAFS